MVIGRRHFDPSRLIKLDGRPLTKRFTFIDRDKRDFNAPITLLTQPSPFWQFSVLLLVEEQHFAVYLVYFTFKAIQLSGNVVQVTIFGWPKQRRGNFNVSLFAYGTLS